MGQVNRLDQDRRHLRVTDGIELRPYDPAVFPADAAQQMTVDRFRQLIALRRIIMGLVPADAGVVDRIIIGRDINVRMRTVGVIGNVLQGVVDVGRAGLIDGRPHLPQISGQIIGGREGNIFFEDPAQADRPRIVPAVAGIDHDDLSGQELSAFPRDPDRLERVEEFFYALLFFHRFKAGGLS